MNRFINRIVSHRSRGVLPREIFHEEIRQKQLIWFGEFHSEERIVAFQNDLVAACTSASTSGCPRHQATAPPQLHVVMEHFSIGMQGILDRFQTDPTYGFDELKRAYADVGTEGHNLDPYEGLLMYCKGGGVASGAWQDRAFLDVSRGCDIKLHGGFLPRPLAARWNKAKDAGEKADVLEECYQSDLLPSPSNPMHRALLADAERLLLQGSPAHFRLIRSLMSGEDLYGPGVAAGDAGDGGAGNEGPPTPLQKLYQAQLLKDHAMGYHLSKLLAAHGRDRFLVVAGAGHLKHYLGVPERLEAYLRAQTVHAAAASAREAALHALLVCTQRATMTGCQMLYETYLEDRYEPLKEAIGADEEEDEDEDNDEDDDDDSSEEGGAKARVLNDLFLNKPELFDRLVLESDVIQGPLFNFSQGSGKFVQPSYNYCFVYDEDDDNLLLPGSGCPVSAAKIHTDVTAKAETREAYNSVGATAGNRGNLKKATAIMRHLQYTDEDMALIGEDCLFNFQGVANPHRVARLRPGERVLDLGSGLGCDSVLAFRRVAPAGVVVGVDLAPKQVAHSNAMAKAKGAEHLTFIQGDAERLAEALRRNHQPPGFDVCISNGAFCLIPDKRLAFQQVYEALRPGGRMAISTTTMQKQLDQEFEWPVCMQMFADLDDLRPMCEGIGFQDVRIVDAESPMEMEFEEDIFEGDNPARFKIHGKYADQYEYLEKMDMDELCKIVTVYGIKP